MAGRCPKDAACLPQELPSPPVWKGRRNSSASTADETLTMTDAASTRSDPDQSSASCGSSRSSPPRPRFRGGLSRAASYLMRRSISKRRGSIDAEEPETTATSTATATASYNNLFSSDCGRVKDVFSAELNRCSTHQLPQLRRERESENPIICYENDDEDNGGDNEHYHSSSSEGEDDFISSQAQGRSDSVFFTQPEQSSHDGSSDGRKSLHELLRLSSSTDFRCNVCRAHYIPQSTHIALPKHFPMMQQ